MGDDFEGLPAVELVRLFHESGARLDAAREAVGRESARGSAILRALVAMEGTQEKAAKAVGISQASLSRRLKREEARRAQ